MHSTSPFRKGLVSTLALDSECDRKRLKRVDGKRYLPGQPWITLEGDDMLPYLRKTHLVSALDKVAPYLWLFTTPSHRHITPLHTEAAIGRRIVVIEQPGLHGLWYNDMLFIQPIPPFLFSTAFWDYIYEADLSLAKTLAGFMRSYCLLIRHEADFRLATSPDLNLIPRLPDGPGSELEITFERFVAFMAQVQHLDDAHVSPRYAYGFIRLSKLNSLSFLFFGRFAYFQVHRQLSTYVASFMAPVVTLFVVLSSVLSCMQVALAAQSTTAVSLSPVFATVSNTFAIVVSIVAAVGVGLVVVLVVWVEMRNLVIFSLSLFRRRTEQARIVQEGSMVW